MADNASRQVGYNQIDYDQLGDNFRYNSDRIGSGNATPAEQNVIKYALPGFGGAFLDNAANKKAEAGQIQAGEDAKGYLQQNLNYVRNQNAPLISMGDQQLEALRRGVESGAFGADEAIFNDYQQYVAPQYEPGGKFQYENRQSLVTPEKFQYYQQNPESFSYQQQAPAQFTYNQQAQQSGQGQQQGQSGGQPQYDAKYADTLNGEQRNEYNRSIFMPNQQQRVDQQSQFNQQQPQQQQYQPYQDNMRAPQFNPLQNQQQAPQQYQAGNAPTAQYVQPQQQYQGQQFSLQNDPVYQKRLADSSRAIEASGAAKGMQLSGANLKALQQNAGDIAAQEGDAAFNRFQQQDQTNYNRFQDQRTDLKDTTRYQAEDEYRRYLDSQNIKGSEADKAIAQWNTDRSFNQNSNVQNFQTQQGAYNQNRGQNADIANMNAQNTLAYSGQNLEQYNTNRNFAQGAQAQNYDQYMQGRQQAQSENAQNYNQFSGNRDYAAGQNQQNIQNQFDAYGVNNTNFNTDRSFDYGVNSDYNQNQFDALKYNVDNSQTASANKYGMLTDAYTRQAADKQNKYGMISDLANVGMTARQQNTDATTGYYGGMADTGMQQANASAAATAARSGKSGILGLIGL